MKTALYTAALGAALLLTASTAPVQAEVRDCAVDIKSLCAGIPARRRACSRVPAVAHQRTLCRLLVNSVKGCMDRQGVRRGHPPLLPQS